MKKVPILVLLIVVLLSAHTLIYPQDGDQGICSYIGWQMTEGKLPYKDTWDINAIGLFAIYALSELVFGHNVWGIRLLELIWQTLAALAIFAFASSYYKNKLAASAAAILYVLALFRYEFEDTAQPDGLLNLFVALSFVFALRKRAMWWVLGGLSLGLAFWIKYPAAIFAAPFAMLLTQNNRGIKPPVYSALALSGTVMAGILLLAATGMLAPLIEIQGRMVSSYTMGELTLAGLVKRLIMNLGMLNYPIYSGPMLWVLAIIALFTANRTFGFEALLILSGIAYICVQGKFYPYHHLALVYALAIPAGRGFGAAWDFVKTSQARRIALYVTTIILAFPLLDYRFYCLSLVARNMGKKPAALESIRFILGEQSAIPGYSYQASFETAQYIKSHTTPEDTVFLWGQEPLINYLAERRNPSRFTYNVPLRGRFNSAENRRELMDTLSAEPPKLLIVAKNDVMGEATSGERGDSLQVLKTFPELVDFTNRHYRYETTIGKRFIILSRIQP